MNNKIRPLALCLFITVLLMSGCNRSGKIIKMDQVRSNPTNISYQSGKAVIVFFRKKDQLFRSNAGVFNVTNEKIEIIGLLASATRLVYQIDPGQYSFMSAGWGLPTAFMDADLKADKIYYVQVKVGTNDWGDERYEFVPAPELANNSTEYKITQQTRLVKKNGNTKTWQNQNMPDLLRRLSHYNKPSQETPTAHLY